MKDTKLSQSMRNGDLLKTMVQKFLHIFHSRLRWPDCFLNWVTISKLTVQNSLLQPGKCKLFRN